MSSRSSHSGDQAALVCLGLAHPQQSWRSRLVHGTGQTQKAPLAVGDIERGLGPLALRMASDSIAARSRDSRMTNASGLGPGARS